MKPNLDIAVTTNKGRRSHNEDNFVCKNKLRKLHKENVTIRAKSSLPCICSVCDGMGGLSAGEKYSYLASNYIRKNMTISFWDRWRYRKREEISKVLNKLERRIQELNDTIYQSVPRKQAGGTTLAMIYVTREKILAANVGDSRIYTFKNSHLSQISIDHNDNLLKPTMNESQHKNGPRRSSLTQYIGISPQEMMLEPSIVEISYEDMIILLCSDGLTERLSDETIQQLLLENSDKKSKELTKLLVEQALKLGTKDNVTALIVKINR